MIRARHAMTLALAACDKEKVVGPKPNEITGTWNATKVEFVKKSAPATRADSIALGATVSVRISLSANTLSLAGAGIEYDFDGDHVPEEAEQNTTLVR